MELADYKRQFREFLDTTRENRDLQLRDRAYKDHKQWTSREAKVLQGRKQAAVVFNRIRPKHNALLGMERQSRTDPKAFPRTPQHQNDADAVTDALRFVADNTGFDQIASKVFDYVTCEGYAAAIVEMKGDEIDIRQIPWNRFYYDPHSSDETFKDAAYLGISTWMYKDEIQAMWPDVDVDQLGTFHDAVDDTFEDRPLWIDRANTKRPRFRVNEHYFLEGGVWNLVFFAGDTELQAADKSPFVDDKSEPMCPIEANSAYVDIDNNRFGEIRGWIHPQDEINHRRSKALHMLSRVRVIGKAGAVESTTQALSDLASGDAWIELKDAEGFQILDNAEFTTGQLELLQEAKNEIDAVGVNAALTGKDDQTVSGRAIQAKQQAGVAELSVLFDNHNAWKRNVYRQIWCRIKQFWTEERWIRVTDDEQNIKFAALNKRITGRDLVGQKFGLPPGEVDRALAENGISMLPNQLDRVVGVENDVSQLDVDIIVAESPDVVSIKQEKFETLARLAERYGPQEVPFEELLRLSNFPDVEAFLDRVKGSKEQREAVQQQALADQQENQQIARAREVAEIKETIADTEQKQAQAEQVATETQLALFGVENIG